MNNHFSLRKCTRFGISILLLTQLFSSPVLASSEYVVKQGDNLTKISKSTGISISTLKSLNNLSSDKILIGQKLKLNTTVNTSPVSTPSQTFNTYVVVKGDSLSKISLVTKTPINTLKSLNQLKSDVIRIGQTLKYPSNGTVPSPSAGTPPVQNTTPISATTYVVKQGDSLWGIAKSFNVSLVALQELNQIQTHIIRAGQTLKIPTAPNTYTPNSPSPSPMPTFPNKAVTKEVLGFTVKYSASDLTSFKTLQTHHSNITSIATATHVTDGWGNLMGNVPLEQLTVANQNNVQSTLMVGNDFNRTVATTLLISPTNRSKLVSNIKSVLQNNQYKGVNIDLENLSSFDRNNYTSFMKEVYETLKPLGYTVSISLPAKTKDDSIEYWTYAYDYRAIEPYVDYAMIMTYDEHYSGGTAGAIASIGWVEKVINYTKSVMPKEKILLGVANYGYDWASGISTKSLGYNQVMNVANQTKAKIVMDNATKSPYFYYWDGQGRKHTVWFESPESMAYKLNLVNKSGIRGIGIWRLGLEDNEFWKKVDAYF